MCFCFHTNKLTTIFAFKKILKSMKTRWFCPISISRKNRLLYNGYLEFIQSTVCSTIRILKGLRDYNDHAHDDPLRILEFWRVWKQLRWNGLVLEDPCAHHLLLRRPTVSWPPPFYWAPDFQTKFFTKNQIIHFLTFSIGFQRFNFHLKFNMKKKYTF